MSQQDILEDLNQAVGILLEIPSKLGSRPTGVCVAGPRVLSVVGSHVYDRTEPITNLTLRDGAMLIEHVSQQSEQQPQRPTTVTIETLVDSEGDVVAALRGMPLWHLASDGPTLEIALARLGEMMFMAGGGRAVSDEVTKAVVVAINEHERALGVPSDMTGTQYIQRLKDEIARLTQVLGEERARAGR